MRVQYRWSTLGERCHHQEAKPSAPVYELPLQAVERLKYDEPGEVSCEAEGLAGAVAAVACS